MTQEQDFEYIARHIIDSIFYMTLGTADENGQPWVSPVYFASSGYKEFYWISSPEARHSHNIAVRPQVSIVIFDSRVTVGSGQAVYMSAVAEQAMTDDLEQSLDIYNERFENPSAYGVRKIMPEDVQWDAPYRLYRAIAQEHWILDPASHPDRRITVAL